MTAQNNEQNQNQKQQGDSNPKPGQQSQTPGHDNAKQADQKKQEQAGAQKDSV